METASQPADMTTVATPEASTVSPPTEVLTLTPTEAPTTVTPQADVPTGEPPAIPNKAPTGEPTVVTNQAEIEPLITLEPVATGEPTVAGATEHEDGESDGEKVEDGYVMVEDVKEFWYESQRANFFLQMETYLANQVDKCDHYKRFFEQQSNPTMAARFATYSVSSAQYLDIVKSSWRKNDLLPKFEFETISFNCLPINVDVKEKELQLAIRTHSLPVSENATIYCIGEFEFPYTKDETYMESFRRWTHSVTIEPQKLFCCSENNQSKQVDKIQATKIKSFIEPESKLTEYERALKFFVDKGKSRTLKRKFKLIKLIFYEKTNVLKCDKRIGQVQVKIDSINDEHIVTFGLPLMDGRKQTEGQVEVKVKVREPLTNKSLRAHTEKILILK